MRLFIVYFHVLQWFCDEIGWVLKCCLKELKRFFFTYKKVVKIKSNIDFVKNVYCDLWLKNYNKNVVSFR